MRTPITLAALLATFLCLGCREETPPGDPQADPPPVTQSDPGGVQPITPSAGPVAPVTGGESVTGSGSGVGQAAKDKARGIGQTQPPRPDED